MGYYFLRVKSTVICDIFSIHIQTDFLFVLVALLQNLATTGVRLCARVCVLVHVCVEHYRFLNRTLDSSLMKYI